MHKVSVISKDLSCGDARNYRRNYRAVSFGKKMLFGAVNLFSSTMVDTMPEIWHHSGIVIDKIFYEYTDTGIFATSEDVLDKGGIYSQHVELLITAETKTKYEKWLTSPYTQNKYAGRKYNNVHHNCILFTEESCEILGLPFPESLKEFQGWLKANPTIIRMAGFTYPNARFSRTSISKQGSQL